jgi:superfamily I DNA/RNA helicase
MRVATLLSEGVAPRAIIAFTFTRLAAEGLKTRILRKVQQLSPTRNLDELSPMFVGTLHAWCLRFLQERVARYATFDLANEHRLVGLLTREYLADIIENFAQIVETEDGGKKKRRGGLPPVPPADGGAGAAGPRTRPRHRAAYLVQHSAGSGKSNSITWLAHQLM